MRIYFSRWMTCIMLISSHAYDFNVGSFQEHGMFSQNATCSIIFSFISRQVFYPTRNSHFYYYLYQLQRGINMFSLPFLLCYRLVLFVEFQLCISYLTHHNFWIPFFYHHCLYSLLLVCIGIYLCNNLMESTDIPILCTPYHTFICVKTIVLLKWWMLYC